MLDLGPIETALIGVVPLVVPGLECPSRIARDAWGRLWARPALYQRCETRGVARNRFDELRRKKRELEPTAHHAQNLIHDNRGGSHPSGDEHKRLASCRSQTGSGIRTARFHAAANRHIPSPVSTCAPISVALCGLSSVPRCDAKLYKRRMRLYHPINIHFQCIL